jgi:hypothetical protein
MPRARFALAIALLTLACGGSTEPPDPTVPASVEISFDTLTTYPGYRVPLPAATVYNGSHQVIPYQIVWSSADTTIAKIKSGATVQANTQGTVALTVTAKNASAVVHLTIIREPVAMVFPNPRNASLSGYDSLQMRGWAAGPEGDSLGDRPVTFSASEPAILSISPTGMLHVRSSGIAQIVVASEGVKDSAHFVVDARVVTRITFTPDMLNATAGQYSQLIYHMFDAAGDTLYDRSMLWSSSDTTVASVQFGDVYAVGAGSAMISVRVDSATASIPVVVQAAP